MSDPNTTNDLFTALETCRAIRRLKETPVPRETLEKLVYYATRASNPGNSQLWSFVVLTDPAKKKKIGAAVRAVMGPAFAGRDAGSGSATQRRMLDGARHLVANLERVPAFVFVCAKDGYPPNNPARAFVWSAVYPASQNLILAARGLGLGTVFTTFQMVAEPIVRETLGIPDEILIGTTICVGYPETPFGPVSRKPVAEVIHWEKW
jgi:nitroreductase